MRIRLLAAIAGHHVGDVLDHDRQAAEWLVAGGFAVPADAGDTDATEPTDPGPAEAPNPPQRQPTATTRRTGNARHADHQASAGVGSTPAPVRRSTGTS